MTSNARVHELGARTSTHLPNTPWLDASLLRQVDCAGQQHVFQFWNDLSERAQRDFALQLAAVDWSQLQRLHSNSCQQSASNEQTDDKTRSPAKAVRIPCSPVEEAQHVVAQKRGEEVLSDAQVAVLVVAGGQGTRLGFPHPKGMFPIGPVSSKSLFQLLSEKVVAASTRYKVAIPYLIMTSDSTHDETVAWFEKHTYFGLSPDDVYFFQQGCLPIIDSRTGKALLADKGQLCMSADGHGGVVAAMARAGLLDRLRDRGIEYLFYHQVDNPLVHVCDPIFIGHHAMCGSEASTKVVAKRSALEKVGVLVEIDGRTQIVEYCDLPPELATSQASDGSLRYWAGNTAIHVFNRSFLERVASDERELPWHSVLKKTRCIDDQGNQVEPSHENGLKFERFIFDALPLANRTLVIETERSEEFAPLKSSEGEASPPEVRRCLIELATRWLHEVGIEVPKGTPVEISPLVATSAADLAEVNFDQVDFQGPVYLDSSAPVESSFSELDFA